MLTLKLLLSAALAAGLASCQSTRAEQAAGGMRLSNVKTTAYTHTEKDHLKYKTASAVGGKLKYGGTRSAAADWSVYPVGTVFKIEGDKNLYEVDDYGSALVGTRTIDLYKPTKSAMKAWGARKVDIQVVRWGSPAKSLAILKPRAKKAPHVAKMVTQLQRGNQPG